MNTKPLSLSDLSLAVRSQPFLDYLEEWLAGLSVLPEEQIFSVPQQSAVFSVDVIQGFCKSGALASPRVSGIVTPIVELMLNAWEHGIRNMVLIQDTHEPQAVEFGAWPPHCVRGTEESEAVDELKNLPFYEQILTIPKNSISSTAATGLKPYVQAHPEIQNIVVVGDCTDLCVYQLAMDLRVEANARQLQRRVIVPANCVDTYDTTVETARSAGILPHPAELLHGLFLYHMALNGIEVVKAIGK